MKITNGIDLRNVYFWSGARDRVKYLTDSQLDEIQEYLKELYPDGLTEIEVNNIFWFEEDWIAEQLGYSDFEELMNETDA